MTYKEETKKIADERAAEIAEQFKVEVRRLLNSGGVNPEEHHRGILFGVALENIADGFIGRRTGNRTYRSMKRF